jgi:hypothetical protein
MMLASAALAPATQAQNYDPYYGRDDYRPPTTHATDNSYGGRVRCESRDGRTEYCGVDIRGGVRLVRQMSTVAACAAAPGAPMAVASG